MKEVFKDFRIVLFILESSTTFRISCLTKLQQALKKSVETIWARCFTILHFFEHFENFIFCYCLIEVEIDLTGQQPRNVSCEVFDGILSIITSFFGNALKVLEESFFYLYTRIVENASLILDH